MLPLTYAFKTDKGRVRDMNQDSLVILAPEQLEARLDGLFVVADGIGGGSGGEIASKIAIDVVADAVRACARGNEGAAAPLTADTLIHTALSALHAANAAVWKRAHTEGPYGMGTTCVLALVQGDRLIVGNVGDSRCYLLRAAHLLQLTHDHAFLHAGRGSRSREEGGPVQFRQVMTRAIGFAGMVEPEVECFALKDGDTLLLCSDGLSNLLDEAEIKEILTANGSPDRTCARLVARANSNGGEDNITVIVIHYGAAGRTMAQNDKTEEKEAVRSPQVTANVTAAPDRADTASLPWWKKLARLRQR